MSITDELKLIMTKQRELDRDLAFVRALRLPEWAIAAGYVRNAVWDHLHGYPSRTPLEDVDVLFHDPDRMSEAYEKQLERELRRNCPEYRWSVKNQARMHIRNGEAAYRSIEDAMSRWPETATATGIHMNDQGGFEVIAPHGLEDLFALKLRRSPLFKDQAFFHDRVRSKQWLSHWPKLTLIP